MKSAIPTQIKLKADSGVVEFCYEDEPVYALSFEFLRVHSPSAEVRGHGIGDEKLQYGKKGVLVKNIEPVGNYAIKLVFSDGHDSGLYTWALLHELCQQRDQLWQQYLVKLESVGLSREP